MSLILINLKLEFLSGLAFGLDAPHPKGSLFPISQANRKTLLQLLFPTEDTLSSSVTWDGELWEDGPVTEAAYAGNNLALSSPLWPFTMISSTLVLIQVMISLDK